MEIKIGKKKLKQIEGSSVDDIVYQDEDGKLYSFDDYINLIKNTK